MKNSDRVSFEKIKNASSFKFSYDFLDRAIEYSTNKVFSIMGDYVHYYPTASSTNLMYGKQKNSLDWVNGFWTGILWLSYELTENQLFRAVAESQFDDYQDRLDKYIGLDHHDIGFLYIPSVLAQYKITSSLKSKKLALKAAKQFSKRYSPIAKIIQVRDRACQGNFIVDCCMNIPILFWAAMETGDREYYLKALNHITQVCNYIIRDDASTFQIYKIDEVSGEPQFGSQGQGYNDTSCWARGQAWVIYGLALAYRYTHEEEFLNMSKRVANYCLNRLPSDKICTWDLIFTGDNDPRDSSAAPIIACGLLEISKYLPSDDEHKEVYFNAAGNILMNLSNKYLTVNKSSNGLLLHGVYTKKDRPGKEGIGCGDDECCIWGDYFYLEGLTRLKQDWNLYW